MTAGDTGPGFLTLAVWLAWVGYFPGRQAPRRERRSIFPARGRGISMSSNPMNGSVEKLAEGLRAVIQDVVDPLQKEMEVFRGEVRGDIEP